jgi:hypothetical protein
VIADAAQLITEVARKKPDSRVELRIKRGQADLLQSIQISERPSSSDENAVDSLER